MEPPPKFPLLGIFFIWIGLRALATFSPGLPPRPAVMDALAVVAAISAMIGAVAMFTGERLAILSAATCAVSSVVYSVIEFQRAAPDTFDALEYLGSGMVLVVYLLPALYVHRRFKHWDATSSRAGRLETTHVI